MASDNKIKTELTEADKKHYVDKAHGKCPFCGDEDIVGGSIEIDCNQAVQEVDCSNCSASWKDVYTLSDIEVESPPELVEDDD